MSNVAHKSGTNHNSKYWSIITAPFGQLTVTESFLLPPIAESVMQEASERYREKAHVCEHSSREASDEATKVAWAEIAIQWHALSNRVAQEAGIRANH
jgi:hypothetical protein